MISSLLKVLNILILCWKINQNSKIHQSRIVSIDQLYHQQMIFKKKCFWSMKQISLYMTKNVLVLVMLSWILRVLNILIMCWKIYQNSKIHQSRIVSIDQLYHQQMIFQKMFLKHETNFTLYNKRSFKF
jgi:hypothetical protein